MIQERIASQRELTPLNRIRVETALSRFPIHRLAKKGSISIDLLRLSATGDADVKWEVTYNIKHGQPGPLAYKVDTLIVNRQIDEVGRPLPEVIRLGSLSDICRMLGSSDSGANISDLRKAFLQNASVFINAKIRYTPKNKSARERWAEIGYTRYSVIFTGEELPDGRKADAVYLVLNPPYRDFLNRVEFRPLDYDYLAQLAPGPQRFYELASFQVYGAVASRRSRAKLLYSEYCLYAPQTRYSDWEHVRKQMYKVHVPHLKSGYIAKVDYQPTKDAEGNPDWEMMYTPGPKAVTEYQAFANRQSRTQPSQQPLTSRNIIQDNVQEPIQASLDLTEDQSTLLSELTQRGITEKKARDLVANLKPTQELMDQLEYLDQLIAQAPQGKFHNPSGFYVKFIEDNAPVPDSFWSTRRQRLHDEAQKAQNAERARLAELEIAYDEYQTGEMQRFISAVLPAQEYQRMFDECHKANRVRFQKITAAQLDELTRASVCAELKQSCRVPTLSFEEFCRQNTQLLASM